VGWFGGGGWRGGGCHGFLKRIKAQQVSALALAEEKIRRAVGRVMANGV
jgi:hypothetical protein